MKTFQSENFVRIFRLFDEWVIANVVPSILMFLYVCLSVWNLHACLLAFILLYCSGIEPGEGGDMLVYGYVY